jgi:phosphatidylglycerophosphate synthase
MTFFGILMAATLAEAGRRYHHANFIWSYRISQQLIFVFSTVEFLRWKKEAPRNFWFWLTAGVLALHIVSGMVYIGRIWSGGLYY